METEFPGDDFFGLQYLMSDDILNHIVDLTHYKKLANVALFLEQTDWRHTGNYGPQILELINVYVLPLPLPPPPLPPSLSLLPSSQTVLQGVSHSLPQVNEWIPQAGLRKSQCCAACGADNHICMFQPILIFVSS